MAWLNEEVAGLLREYAETSIRTSAGLQVDLRVVQLDAWGAALQYFTGSQAHNVAVRQVAIRQKLKLSEYGVFDAGTGELIVSRTEEEVYARLGLAWIPSAMREDHGEVEMAARGQIPRLVRENDLRGDLHTHTDLTDGVASLEDMVAAAARRGYEYYAITDHAPNLLGPDPGAAAARPALLAAGRPPRGRPPANDAPPGHRSPPERAGAGRPADLAGQQRPELGGRPLRRHPGPARPRPDTAAARDFLSRMPDHR
jgi:DNA polymerase beta thumb/PHP domain